jgi:mono/diheme cytochrome c family protein
MRAICAAFLLLAASPQYLSAQQADALNDTQKLGHRLFVQSCAVCHLKPQITSVRFGPELSRESASGREDAMREVIANGTPRMPGFKYHFDQTQIAAIASYLKTVPAPQPAASQAPQAAAPQGTAPRPRNRENPAEAD